MLVRGVEAKHSFSARPVFAAHGALEADELFSKREEGWHELCAALLLKRLMQAPDSKQAVGLIISTKFCFRMIEVVEGLMRGGKDGPIQKSGIGPDGLTNWNLPRKVDGSGA